jgi:HNH endonuclease/AP2 domain
MMPKALTKEFVRSILDYDPDTGVFRWKHRADRAQRWNTRYAGKISGTIDPFGYVIIQIEKGSNYRAHILAWLYMTGEWRPGGVDHRHGIRNDNRFSELRRASPSENGSNKRMQSNNSSGHIGVHFDRQRGKWRARINYKNRMYDVGFFDTPEAAAAARAERLKEIHGEFAATSQNRPRYFHSRDHRSPPFDV